MDSNTVRGEPGGERPGEIAQGRREPTGSPEPLSSSESAIERATADLLEGFRLLTCRGVGGMAWATPFGHHPIAFLLDSIGDAAILWGPERQLLYQNRAALELAAERTGDSSEPSAMARGRRFDRRCLHCHAGDSEYVLEIVHELPEPH